MVFETHDQAQIRRVFDSVTADVGPAPDLARLIERAEVIRARPPVGSSRRSFAIATAGFVAAAVLGISAVILLDNNESTGLDVGGSAQPAGTSTPAVADPSAAIANADLLACMVGTWQLDVAAYESAVQAILDPGVDYHEVTVESGGGVLTIRADQTFTVSYDQLTYRIRELQNGQYYDGIPDVVVVTSGEVTAGFALQGNVFLAGDFDGAPLEVLVLNDGTWSEVPPVSARDASLRLGTRANRPIYVEKITIDCSGDRLVVNDEVRIDTSTGDGPSTIWSRSENG